MAEMVQGLAACAGELGWIHLMGMLLEKLYKMTSIHVWGVTPYWVKYSLLKIIWKACRKFVMQCIAPYCISTTIRILLYRLCGVHIGKHVFIGMRCYIDDMEPQMIFIGDNVSVSFLVCLCTHGKRQTHTPIRIEDGAYVGCRTTVLSGKRGVTIGKNAVVGACSFVNKDIPPDMTAVGVPARIMKTNVDRG